MILLKASAQTIYLNFDTGLTISAGESQISKDGGAFANTTNLPAEIGTTGVYTLALTAAEKNADQFFIRVTDGGVEKFAQAYQTTGEPIVAVVADAGNSNVLFKTDQTGLSNDELKDGLLEFRTGTLGGKRQVRKVNSSNGTTGFVTMNAPYTTAPSDGDLAALIT